MCGERDDTLTLLREARPDLKTVMVELSKAEYLLAADLPQLPYLEDAVHGHVRTLPAGPAVRAKQQLEADGVVAPPEQ
jgi:hypothetical protein